MTTIAWDGKTLAADRRQTLGSNEPQTTTKIAAYGDYFMGASGGTAAAKAMLDWAIRGCRAGEFPTGQSGDDWARTVVINTKTRNVHIYERVSIPIQISTRFYATGSGCEYALGAMAAGADARQAVLIAARFDMYTGDGVDSFSLED